MARIALAAGFAVAGALTFGLGAAAGLGIEGGFSAALEGMSLGAAVGNTLGGLLFPSHLTQFGPKLQDLTVSSSTPGNPIPFGYGIYKIAGMLGWCPGLVEHSLTTKKSAKGGPTVTTTSFTYTASFQVFCGEGPGTVLKIWGDSKVLFDQQPNLQVINYRGDWDATTNYNANDIVTVQKDGSGEFIFGQQQHKITPLAFIALKPSLNKDPLTNEGKAYWERYTGSLTNTPPSTTQYPSPTFYNGTADQMPDPTIQADRGPANVSAHRGLIHFVYEDLPVLNFGNRVPNIQVLVAYGGIPTPLSSHVEGTFDDFACIDSNGIGYLTENGTDVVMYDCATGEPLGKLGSFSISNATGGLRLKIVDDPVFGRWLAAADGQFGKVQCMAVNAAALSTGATPPAGTITNFVQASHAGILTYVFSGWDVDSLGRIWVTDGAVSSSMAWLDKITFFETGGAAHLQLASTDLNAAYGYIGVGNILADNVDDTLIIAAATSGGSGSIVIKYDPSGPTIITSRTDIGLGVGANMGIDENYMVVGVGGAVKYSGHDLHTVASYSFAGFTGATLYGGGQYDGNNNALWIALSGSIGIGHQLARINLADIPHSAVVTDITADANVNGPNLICYQEGIALSPDGEFVIANHHNFFDFVRMGFAPGYARVSDVIKDICIRAGIPASQIDVSQVAALPGIYGEIPGYICSRPTSAKGDLAPVCTAYFIDAVESDFTLKFVPRGVNPPVMTIPEDDLGLVNKQKVIEAIGQTVELPKTVTVVYNGLNVEYQQTKWEKSRSSRVVKTQNSIIIELPMLLRRFIAVQIADKAVYLAATERNAYQFDLWRASYMQLDATDVLDFIYQSLTFRARLTKSTIGQGFLCALASVSHDDGSYTSQDAGGDGFGPPPPPIKQFAATVLVLYDLPLLQDSDANDNQTGYYFAESSPDDSWPGGVVMRSTDNVNFQNDASSGARAGYGVATNVLGTISLQNPNPGFLDWDVVNTVIVQMTYQPFPFSTSTDHDVLFNGANAILVGNEVVQFVNAHDNGDGTVTLSRLIRGRRNTDAFCNTHGANETVIDLSIPGLGRKQKDLSVRGVLGYYKGVTLGQDPSLVDSQQLTINSNDLKPASPIHLDGSHDAEGNFTITWFRRTRYGWDYFIDGIGVTPPLHEQTEAYDVEILNGGGGVVRTFSGVTSPTVSYSVAQILADFGSVQSFLRVRVYQLSAVVGRGFPAENDNLGNTGTIGIVGTIAESQAPQKEALSGTITGPLYDFTVYVPGQPANSFVCFYEKVKRAYNFAANFGPQSGGVAQSTSAGTAVFTIYKNGVSVGTVTFTAGVADATLSCSAFSLAVGDIFSVVAPTSSDASLSGITIVLSATR